MALSRGKRWFLGLASIPVFLVAIVLMWAYGWLTPTPELGVIKVSFEPYVVESGVLVESDYHKDVLGLSDPFAVFSYELADGYSMWELSEELREAAMADGWLIKGVTDERDDHDTAYAHCRWSTQDRGLSDVGRFQYHIITAHECNEGSIIRLTVGYVGEVD